MEAYTDFYINPCTATKTNITINSDNQKEYEIANVYYTPIVGENKGLIQLYTESALPYSSTYSISTAEILDTEGKATELSLNLVLKYKFPQKAYDLYISEFYTDSLNNAVIIFINEGTRVPSSIILEAAVLRNGCIYKYNKQTVNMGSKKSLSVTCNLEDYIPQKGDIIKIAAIEGNVKFIENSVNGNGVFSGLAAAAMNTPVTFLLNADNKITMIDTVLTGNGGENDTMTVITQAGSELYYRPSLKILTLN